MAISINVSKKDKTINAEKKEKLREFLKSKGFKNVRYPNGQGGWEPEKQAEETARKWALENGGEITFYSHGCPALATQMTITI